MIFEILFWLSFATIFYVYLGYPLAVYLASLLIKAEVRKSPFEPAVTILIAAYNEEESIAQTIENKLSLDYPGEKLEIIVVSDGSADKTDDLVRQYAPRGVKLLRQEPRAGKTSALNMAMDNAEGDIIVFSDANSIYAKDALSKLIENFADPEVGYVTGKMIYVSANGSPIGDGNTSYMKYENFLRRCETRIGSVVGVDGGIDAVRKHLYSKMNDDQLPDFVLPLKVVEQGFRVIYEPRAILEEHALDEQKDEYQMRVRVSLRALWALWDMRRLLSPKRYGIYAWQLWSHKVLRYCAFMFLLLAYFANLALLENGGIYLLLFAAQSLAYVFGLLKPLPTNSSVIRKVQTLLHYFVLLNMASAHAIVKFLGGQKQVIWTPRKG